MTGFILITKAAKKFGVEVGTLRRFLHQKGADVLSLGSERYCRVSDLVGAPVQTKFSPAHVDFLDLRKHIIPNVPGIEEWVSATDGARLIGCTPPCITEWYQAGLIRGRRVGKVTLYRRDELLARKPTIDETRRRKFGRKQAKIEQEKDAATGTEATAPTEGGAVASV